MVSDIRNHRHCESGRLAVPGLHRTIIEACGAVNDEEPQGAQCQLEVQIAGGHLGTQVCPCVVSEVGLGRKWVGKVKSEHHVNLCGGRHI